MVVKVDKHGNRYYEPPYTQAEEDEFYRRVGGGPVAMARPTSAAIKRDPEPFPTAP